MSRTATAREPAVDEHLDISDRVRGRTMVLLDACLEACEAYDRRFSAAFDRRARRHGRSLDDSFAVGSAEFDAYSATVMQLRTWCAADEAAAGDELVALAIEQVETDLRLQADLRVLRTHADREAARQRALLATHWLFLARDELQRGLGWPHRGEEVLVVQAQGWARPRRGQPVQVIRHDGAALYHGSYSTTNTQHAVHAAGHVDQLLVTWTSPQRRGIGDPADPHGSIAMRVASAPDRSLPLPFPRWPTPADVPVYDRRAEIAVGEQLTLG